MKYIAVIVGLILTGNAYSANDSYQIFGVVLGGEAKEELISMKSAASPQKYTPTSTDLVFDSYKLQTTNNRKVFYVDGRSTIDKNNCLSAYYDYKKIILEKYGNISTPPKERVKKNGSKLKMGKLMIVNKSGTQTLSLNVYCRKDSGSARLTAQLKR